MITIPVIALRSMTVLPDMVIHFDISRKISIKAVEAAMENDEKVLLLTQTDSAVKSPTAKDLYMTFIFYLFCCFFYSFKFFFIIISW